jgi:hypothetical protein
MCLQNKSSRRFSHEPCLRNNKTAGAGHAPAPTGEYQPAATPLFFLNWAAL